MVDTEVRANLLAETLSQLQTISLDETVNKSALLNRVDTKYVTSTKILSRIIMHLESNYRVLQIDGLQHFEYRSCYYDDDNICYFDHHSGKRKRFKVRTRHYVDSDEHWFEVKLKGNNGETKKSRLKCEKFMYQNVAGGLRRHLELNFQKNYKISFNYQLTPSLVVSYRRSTLVCNSKQERVTIDTDLQFYDPRNSEASFKLNSAMAIVEIKSDGKRGNLEDFLFLAGCRQEEKLSKYCLGVASLNPSIRRNNFLPILKKLEKQGFVTRTW